MWPEEFDVAHPSKETDKLMLAETDLLVLHLRNVCDSTASAAVRECAYQIKNEELEELVLGLIP